MTPRRIAGANHYLGAPRNWKPDTDGDCGHLAIRTAGDPRAGSGWCESAWEPTPAELAAINAGGSIILRVIGWQPPVALYVERVADRPEPVEPAHVAAAPDIAKAKVCPKCEMEAEPLAFFCQSRDCPIREWHRGRAAR